MITEGLFPYITGEKEMPKTKKIADSSKGMILVPSDLNIDRLTTEYFENR